MKKRISCVIATALVATNSVSIAAQDIVPKDGNVEGLIEGQLNDAVESTIQEVESIIEEIKPIELENSNIKSPTGILEIDINFPMPIVDSSNVDLLINIYNGENKIVSISGIENLNGSLENGISYKIEKLNSKKQPLEGEENNIYFLHITLENLELGTYNAEISSQGYINTKVDSIDIENYSKRVSLGYKYYDDTTSLTSGSFLSGDINGDYKIDLEDYNLVFENINTTNRKFDLNKDGVVDIADLSYVNENIGSVISSIEVKNTNPIINVENIKISGENLVVNDGGNITDLFIDNNKSVAIGKLDGVVPSEESPLEIKIDLLNSEKDTRTFDKNNGIEMDQIVIKAPITNTSEEAGAPEKGYVTYIDNEGKENRIDFGDEQLSTYSDSNDIVIDLGSQIAVKEITINVTGNRGNKKISEIASIEFLNNVYKELPKPEMNIPQIKKVETSTNMHDERITLEWEAQPNVTAYEVKYEKLDNNGNVTKTKKLQTNKTKLNILDKEIKPYDIYRVSIQSLNGDWSSGYEFETGSENSIGHSAFDGIADNVDKDFNPIESYYSGDKGTVSEIQVIPIQSPEPPRNLTTNQGFKSFTINWEQHSQARDFDIYYRKIGEDSTKWIKANENNIEVTENSQAVTNPDKSKLVRSHSYTVNGLEDNTSYQVRVTATNHLGTSKMSEVYIASTVSVIPPVMSEYKLINRPSEDNEIGTSHIIDVRNKLDEDGWANSDNALIYDSENSLVDGDFTTSWKVNDWDTGAVYGSNRGSEITFDNEYEIGTIAFARTLEQGFNGWTNTLKVTYWDEEGTQNVFSTKSIQSKQSNGHTYYIAKLSEPIRAKKIKIDIAGGNWQTISEIKFYEYDSLENDIKGLYEDDLRLVIKEDVTQDKIDALYNRINTVDPISNEYHPDKEVLLKELDNANKLFNDKAVSEKITTLDGSIRTDNVGPALGMQNDWQSLGSVARPGVNDKNISKQIVVYMGSSDPNTRVQITFLQNYGLPGGYQGGTVTIAPGRNEITIPSIISADVEKGGQVMARVTNGSQEAEIKIRLSGVVDIPHLNVNNKINNPDKEEEVKVEIKKYITELRKYISDINSLYPDKVSETDRINNIYEYDEKTSPLNSTDIEGDRFTLTLPASEILKGIESGLYGNEEGQIERVYNALLAWEQEVQVGFAKKGVFEEVKDFNGSGEIDDEDIAYFNKNKAPLTRLNIKYQRMMLGAAAYASSHHIGVGFGSSSYIQGVPYKFDENQELINGDEAHLYGGLIGHEMGHVMDIGDRLYPETSNNLMTAITATMTDNDSPYVSSMKDVYEKVTSNTLGLSTNRSVVLNMLWQPYLAYEDDNTYKMLITDVDGDLSNDSYFAKLNRAYREMTADEKTNGDRDQWLIRMTSKVVGKDLTEFYRVHGIVANETTVQYVSQFPKETKKIQYINDEARRMRMANTADMEEETKIVARFGVDSKGNEISNLSYVNEKEVSMILSVDNNDEAILGYEIYRNGVPCGFVERDKSNEETIYTDIVDNINNRVVEYSVVAYDYNLNTTEEVSLGTIKIRHDGGVSKNNTIITSNTVSINEENNDIHSCDGNEELKLALDDKDNTYYEGRMLKKDEFNSSVHESLMNPNNDPYIILDTTETKTLVGIKYTAPTKKTGLIFKKDTIVDSAIKKYKIEVSKDGVNWTKVKEGTMNLSGENNTETIYFDQEGISGGKQLNSYNTRYVKITALGTKNISVSELELITPPGDNIEIGVAEDNKNYKNGIGMLKEDFVYQIDNIETPDINEEKVIRKGSIIITGEYRGNPAFNVPLVLNQDEEHIGETYKGILMADIPNDGDLQEISEGNWIYWVEPEESLSFMNDNKEIFAELYRTDSADASEGNQRLVSDTFKIVVPDELPEISLSANKNIKSNSDKVVELNNSTIEAILQSR